MIKRILMAIAGVCLLVITGCNLSESTCNTMDALKSSFDRFAAEGEFSRKTVIAVNGVYEPAARACENAGTVTQVEMIALATDAILAIRQAMRESDRAATVMYPQVRELERILDHVR
jgi:hypothetical protein